VGPASTAGGGRFQKYLVSQVS